ncbi:putative receptor-like protein kinase-like protein [Tanacetum coccineum]|uniref:Receptor-like protein kinase-like protein n=1 Tax=Tanacetum coccineum TaxID=301880 RepID=A0ABQ5FLV0_9ASTR
MGACCSKTSTITSTPSPPSQPEIITKHNPIQTDNKNIVSTPNQQENVKKETFLVKSRKSNEYPDQEKRKSIDRKKPHVSNPVIEVFQSPETAVSGGEAEKVVVGAAVRTSSCTKEEVDAILIQCGRLSRSSSGVKVGGGETPTRGRRYSGSKRSFDFDMEVGRNDGDEVVAVEGGRRAGGGSRGSSPSSRRRSRERDPGQQRSGSKERGSGGSGGRRVSRSPNRRSESPNPSTNGGGVVATRPGKMVSVPATDKSGNVAVGGEGVKRIQVKRNGGGDVAAAGSRTAASPRARSPARANLRVLNENQNQNQQPLTLSRSNSRKAEHSPYRRNPLAEIDTNAVGSEQPGSKKQNGEKTMTNKTNNVVTKRAKEPPVIDEAKTSVEKIVSRTRSSRLSRELDIDPETLLNSGPNPTSYASLLLEDIQNFHQKIPIIATASTAATNPPPPAFSIPACVSKACSILEAVADLNSTTSSNNFKKENLVESEKAVNDDLMEPSLHKYVTVRRGGDAEAEEQESSGSNSFAGSQQMSWMSSTWEPNSGDSTNCFTSSSSNARDKETQRNVEYLPRNGIGRGRVGVTGRSAYSLPNNPTCASS